MALFGKNIGEYVAFARTGMILIVLMGLIRFFVGISGVPYERATHLVSMTNLTLLLFVIYGHIAAARGFGTYRHLLPTAAALSIAMYGFIILAILTQGVRGLHGYFHFVVIGGMLIASNFMIPNYFNPEGVSINQHILAHLVGSIVGTIPFA